MKSERRLKVNDSRSTFNTPTRCIIASSLFGRLDFRCRSGLTNPTGDLTVNCETIKIRPFRGKSFNSIFYWSCSLFGLLISNARSSGRSPFCSRCWLTTSWEPPVALSQFQLHLLRCKFTNLHWKFYRFAPRISLFFFALFGINWHTLCQSKCRNYWRKLLMNVVSKMFSLYFQ